MPLDFLLSVMRDGKVDRRTRIHAASLAAPYVHKKALEGGKKEAAGAAAKSAAAGRFGARPAPLKLVGGK